MTAFMITTCRRIPIESDDLVSYLKHKKCDVRAKYRPFSAIEREVACIVIDTCAEMMKRPPGHLMDTGYDAGCADIASIPLLLIMDKDSDVPSEWLTCEHVYKTDLEHIKKTIDVFAKSILKYQEKFKFAKEAPIESRGLIRSEIIGFINDSMDTVPQFIKKKKKEL
jgi:hypothetical protein